VPQDVERRQKTEQIVDALHNAAKELENSKLLKAFKKPKPDAYTNVGADNGIYAAFPSPYACFLTFGQKVAEDVEPSAGANAKESVTKNYDYYYSSDVDDDTYYEEHPMDSHFDRAIDELINTNAKFINALTLYEHIGQFATDARVQRHFLSREFTMAIESLSAFHQQLQLEFERERINGAVFRGAIHQLYSIILKLGILVLLPVSTMPYVVRLKNRS
jgi:hypothetical protein